VKGRRNWRIPVRGCVVTGDSRLHATLAERGLGLAYVLEPSVSEQLRHGKLKVVLGDYAPTVPGFFIYFPAVTRNSAALRLFVDAAKELARRGLD
jgi:DNA-binding transcriptional LysR family regulator